MRRQNEKKITHDTGDVDIEEDGLNGERNTNKASSSNDVSNNQARTNDKKSEEEKRSSKKESVPTIPYYKLFSFADSLDIFLMVLGSVGAIGNGMALPLLTLLFGNLIDSFGETPDTNQVLANVSKVSLDFVYLAIGTGVASFLQLACWMVTGERQAARVRNLYLKTILRQEVGFFDKETNTGEVVGRLSGDTVLIQEAIGEKVGKFISSVATFFGGFTIAFIRGWLLTLVMLSTIPLLLLAAALLATVVTKLASLGQAAYADGANTVEQTIGAIRTVVSFTGEQRAISKYKKSLKSAHNASVKEGLATGLGFGTVYFVIFCGYALGVWYGARLILDKGYTGGKVINVVFAVLMSSFTLGQAAPCITAFAAGQAAGFKMFETIKRKPEIDSYDSSGKVLDDIHGDIELRDVVFSYPTRPEQQIFNGFSLSIVSGTSVALVGESGSGKSTVISRIERFYDPQSGEVLIDGINLKEFQLRWIRGKIGLVSQEPVLFSSSIRENIAYGKEGATLEEIKVVTELANASKFINEMPKGLDTLVGDHGTQLSGGQKQRIAIARAMLKGPRILLLDEATSALDTESEHIVQEALDRVMTNKTTVIVAHRLTTIRNADVIAVVHRGSIVEKGPHSSLIANSNGTYNQLIQLQETKKDLSVESDAISHSTSLRTSLLRSISGGSSAGNISRHSFSANSNGLPIGVGVTEDILNNPTEDEEKDLPEVPVRRLFALNKPEIPLLIVGSIAAVINGVIMPLFGLILASIITTFYAPPEKLKKDSNFWALLFFVAAMVSLLAMPTTSYFFAVAGSKLVQRIRLMCFEKVVYMEVGWFDKPENSSGTIGARLSADAATVRGLVGDTLALAVQNTATLVAGVVIAFSASWQLSLIFVALMPIIGINGYIQMKLIKGFSASAKAMYQEASQVANDAIGSIRTVASFSAEDKVIELYQKKCEAPLDAGVKQGLVSGTGFGVSFSLIFLSYALLFYVGARLVRAGTVTFDDVFKVFFGLAMASMGISQSSSLAPDASKAKSATASVFAIIDSKSTINSSDDSGTVIEHVKGNIDFRHVNFHYATRPDVQIFTDLSFTAHAGKTVALVGESGCGKSTVISLLQRFYDPISGHILLDGIDIQTLKIKWLRKQMGLVSQEPILFNDTIRDNIVYGREEEEEAAAKKSEIIVSSETANAHKFISALHQGYETNVGERGIQLSGGQKQRIAIARAILKEPKILLLDEATSALDAESERVVQDALDKVMVNRTTIIVAHRLSTIKGADMIAVVKNGYIVEMGKHETLINIKGAYASLVALHARSSS